MVDQVSKSREERAKALEKWADTVDASDLKTADTQALREIAELVDRRDDVDEQIIEAVISARRAHAAGPRGPEPRPFILRHRTLWCLTRGPGDLSSSLPIAFTTAPCSF